ncbi:carboxypeptidase-like regulatory domain-containing protein [Chitinophaga costaii]|nr:carboxypeptidase-like regulatory domain-containing protein [Chitinophaga costaii]
MSRLFFFIVVCSISLLAGTQVADAQIKVSGMVADLEGKTGLPAVTIQNLRTKLGTLSSENGRFFVEGAPGDTLEFTMLGYARQHEVIPVAGSMVVYMSRRIYDLNQTTIRARNYHDDSLATRDEYRKYYNYHKPGAMDILKTLPSNPITALSYLVPSKARKQKEHFQHTLVTFEEEKFVDYRYNPELVARMTKLESPALDSFMIKYHPTYQFLKTATDYDLLLYIKQSYEEFKQQEALKPKDSTAAIQ